ncbi:hypothetical protein SERLA73DRAFT_174871 [Serpula lacrymans var. lacrymans S7.3]|uniref:Snurportin-1 n=2 Tax=Serpula lacrymans var. lacrymans TaxID=341189 RepID=F8PJ41_SERL3|nr:uncharacterized protein SERLADRAFT_456566 [Serpula lacrymans var. lacrymans S7.9]EGO03405.1 hypothetical protein SERLA73DRAFT_174871 [Serpula lacrymans var. lacrymans S7.3]EGO29173.1 hypothetical protein SERLADRAFT_456566 [Serpula lacrymans var. lacrymans S7.9]
MSNRKSSYKLPPTLLTDKLQSQEARRSKALEEQKRRRAQKFDSSRGLDSFANLNLGPSDDEGDEVFDEGAEVIREGVANFASMIHTSNASEAPQNTVTTKEAEKESKKQAKSRRRRKKAKPSKWADKCMYAELLEMNEDDIWGNNNNSGPDGLPTDLETGWVAVAPVPVGKRCLAITHQSAGVVGISPNTTLRSRLLGKLLMPRFPSSLPPLTILDCILDPNWRDNGILHVLDVLKWKGQDVGDCETPFRLWWRDMRLDELPKYSAPSTFTFSSPSSNNQSTDTISETQSTSDQHYHFPYPTSFVPIPYHTNTTLPSLSSYVIPLARSSRLVAVDIPNASNPLVPNTMEVDSPGSNNIIPSQVVTPSSAHVESDGLLLYVSQATYEPGTSPLSCWIPNKHYSEVPRDQSPAASTREIPLDLFEKLIQRRLAKGQQVNQEVVPTDMEMA